MDPLDEAPAQTYPAGPIQIKITIETAGDGQSYEGPTVVDVRLGRAIPRAITYADGEVRPALFRSYEVLKVANESFEANSGFLNVFGPCRDGAGCVRGIFFEPGSHRVIRLWHDLVNEWTMADFHSDLLMPGILFSENTHYRTGVFAAFEFPARMGSAGWLGGERFSIGKQGFVSTAAQRDGGWRLTTMSGGTWNDGLEDIRTFETTYVAEGGETAFPHRITITEADGDSRADLQPYRKTTMELQPEPSQADPLPVGHAPPASTWAPRTTECGAGFDGPLLEGNLNGFDDAYDVLLGQPGVKAARDKEEFLIYQMDHERHHMDGQPEVIDRWIFSLIESDVLATYTLERTSSTLDIPVFPPGEIQVTSRNDQPRDPMWDHALSANCVDWAGIHEMYETMLQRLRHTAYRTLSMNGPATEFIDGRQLPIEPEPAGYAIQAQPWFIAPDGTEAGSPYLAVSLLTGELVGIF